MVRPPTRCPPPAGMRMLTQRGRGTETYKAALGADRTVPKFAVNRINLTGSSHRPT